MLYIVIIEYKEDAPVDVIQKVSDLLLSIGESIQLSRHSFFLSTDVTAVEIRDAIKNSPYEISSILVSTVSSPSAWRNLLPENDEIKEFLHK